MRDYKADMSVRTTILLAALGFCLSYSIAQFQAFPGYLDSDYYFAGGIQLVHGRGFTEPYIWNYLDDPVGLPQPSHSYWMPLSSILAAAGMWLLRSNTYAAARLPFIVMASIVPIATAALAYSFSHRRDLALVSGLLALFSIFYAPFLSVPDNYDVFLILGGLYFLALTWHKRAAYVALGAMSGLLTLARTDGSLWLFVLLAVIACRAFRTNAFPAIDASDAVLKGTPTIVRGRALAANLLLALGGFILIAGAWFWRNYSVYGTPLAPGAGHLLWLSTYDETFVYPASQLTVSTWLAQGWGAIISARLAALRWNLLNAVAAQGGIFLAPFILVGLWARRREERVQVGATAWLALLAVMTAVFPFAGARGGFFHAGAALQPLWWSLGPLGLEASVSAARRRNLFTPAAPQVFRFGLVGLAALMTAVIIAIRVLPAWGEGEGNYPKMEAYLKHAGIQPGEPVMVRNPPGYYLMTGRSAVVVPYGDAASMLAVASRYGAKYLIIEAVGAAGPIKSVYEDLSNPHLPYLGSLDGTRVFRIQP